MSHRVTLDDLKDCSVANLYKSGKLISSTGAQNQKGDEQRSNVNDRVFVSQGDITKLALDAIVNAANRKLMGGGGVDGAIHRGAGPGLKNEISKAGLEGKGEYGKAYFTKGHNLPAKHVIHTIGPVYAKTKVEECSRLLHSAYTESLKCLTEHKLGTIAFPSISTGVYGYPMQDATKIALTAVRDYLESNEGASVHGVVFCVFSDGDRRVYLDTIPQIFAPSFSRL